MLAALLAAAVAPLTPAFEYVIDCSTWDGKVETKLEFRFETRDGRAIKDTFFLPPDTDPSSPRLGFRLVLKHHDWRYDLLDGYLVVVRGSRTSPIRSVSFKSDGWAPIYFRAVVGWEPLPAPPPREVKK